MRLAHECDCDLLVLTLPFRVPCAHRRAHRRTWSSDHSSRQTSCPTDFMPPYLPNRTPESLFRSLATWFVRTSTSFANGQLREWS